MREIKINLDTLKSTGLSIVEYLVLWCLYYKNEEYLLEIISLNVDITENLCNKSYMKYDGELSGDQSVIYDFTLRNKALKLFQDASSDVAMRWSLFKSMFPIKDGRRRLHDQQDDCEKKFKKLANEPEEFKKIIKGLNNEMESRRISLSKGEFFPPPKAMSSWLNQKHYLTYQDDIQEDKIEEKVEGI